MSILGTRVVRTEDPRLLTEGGRYTDDLRIPALDGAVRATFVRSPVAHARITGIDTRMALASPGVVAVLTAADLDDISPAGSEAATEPLLAADRVRFVGEAVAVVLTEDGYQGEDAAELVSVDYEPLPAVISLDDALAGHTLLFAGTETNVVGSGGDPAPADAFSGCDVVIERTFPNQRVAPVPLEVRAAAARWAGGRLTVWASTQNAQLARDAVAGTVGLEPGAVRVIAPDVGGGFGAKIAVERDTLVIAWAARRLDRPVRWVETRNENLLGMVHGRAQRHTITIGGTRDGRILAYYLDIIQDCGAYPRFGPFLPTLTKLMASGVYDLPYCGAAYRAVVTNTTPIAAYRGAGSAGGHRRDRAGRGPVRHRDRDGPGRGAAAERGAARILPVHHRERGDLRHRGVRGRAGQGAGRGRVRGAARRAGPPPRRGRPGPAGHRPGQLRGDHRRRLHRR